MLSIVVLLTSCLSCLISCGSPKTNIHVRNNAEGTATDISVQQGEGGSTSVVVSPSANLAIDSIRFKVR